MVLNILSLALRESSVTNGGMFYARLKLILLYNELCIEEKFLSKKL